MILSRFILRRSYLSYIFQILHLTLASVPPRTGEDVDDAVLLKVAVVVEAAAALPRAVKVEHVAEVEVERQEPTQNRLGADE